MSFVKLLEDMAGMMNMNTHLKGVLGFRGVFYLVIPSNQYSQAIQNTLLFRIFCILSTTNGAEHHQNIHRQRQDLDKGISIPENFKVKLNNSKKSHRSWLLQTIRKLMSR